MKFFFMSKKKEEAGIHIMIHIFSHFLIFLNSLILVSDKKNCTEKKTKENDVDKISQSHIHVKTI